MHSIASHAHSFHCTHSAPLLTHCALFDPACLHFRFLFAVVWYAWQGYSDCVDVNVQPGTTAITNRYGLVGTAVAPELIKMDHCEYTYVSLCFFVCLFGKGRRRRDNAVAECSWEDWLTFF